MNEAGVTTTETLTFAAPGTQTTTGLVAHVIRLTTSVDPVAALGYKISGHHGELEWEECRVVQEQPQCALGLRGGQECGLEHQDGQVWLGNAHRSGFLIAALGLGILQGSPCHKRPNHIF